MTNATAAAPMLTTGMDLGDRTAARARHHRDCSARHRAPGAERHRSLRHHPDVRVPGGRRRVRFALHRALLAPHEYAAMALPHARAALSGAGVQRRAVRHGLLEHVVRHDAAAVVAGGVRLPHLQHPGRSPDRTGTRVERRRRHAGDRTAPGSGARRRRALPPGAVAVRRRVQRLAGRGDHARLALVRSVVRVQSIQHETAVP